jgi:hypothetical protein
MMRRTGAFVELEDADEEVVGRGVRITASGSRVRREVRSPIGRKDEVETKGGAFWELYFRVGELEDSEFLGYRIDVPTVVVVSLDPSKDVEEEDLIDISARRYPS